VVDRSSTVQTTVKIIGDVGRRAYHGMETLKYRPTEIAIRHVRKSLTDVDDAESFVVYLIGEDDLGATTEVFTDASYGKMRLGDLPLWALEVLISAGVRIPKYVVNQVLDGEVRSAFDGHESKPQLTLVDGNDDLPDTPSDTIDKD
jgi:hypothetical protein